MRRSTTLTWLVVLGLGLLGCSRAPLGEDTSEATSESESSASESSESSESTSETTTAEAEPNPCGCDESQLCVGTCMDPLGVRMPFVDDLRCIDAELCPEPIDTPACRLAACGDAKYDLQYTCGNISLGDYDLICSQSAFGGGCDPFAQDCPEGEKCVLQISDDDDAFSTQCVVLGGELPAGEACNSAGHLAEAGTDDCDGETMCWSGEPTTEAFSGTCEAYCGGAEDNPICPPGQTCTQVYDSFYWHDFWLCLDDA